MKKILLIALMLIVPLALEAAQPRTVVLEIFTGTWCYYCPAAATGAEDLWEEHEGEVLIVEYHVGSSDPFQNTPSVTRYNVYDPSGVPTAWFDGVIEQKGGGHTGSTFFTYNSKYNQRRNVDPPLDIVLTQTEDAFHGSTGTLTATITNTSSSTVSGTVHFTVTECHIPYSWQGLETLHFVERDMLPSASGEAVSLTAGEEKVVERDYDIDTSWPHFTSDENIKFGCFVQGASGEIYQGAVLIFGESPVGIDEDDPAFAISVPAVISTDNKVALNLDAPSRVSVRMFDASGRIAGDVFSGEVNAGTSQFEIAADGLPQGVYFVNVSIDGVSQTHRTTVLH